MIDQTPTAPEALPLDLDAIKTSPIKMASDTIRALVAEVERLRARPGEPSPPPDAPLGRLLDDLESFLDSVEWNDTLSELTAGNFSEAIRAWRRGEAIESAPHPLSLNAEQEEAVKSWAADDRLWTTQETVEFNLRTFARTMLSLSAAAPPETPRQEE